MIGKGEMEEVKLQTDQKKNVAIMVYIYFRTNYFLKKKRKRKKILYT